jgi:hypothetical protein
MHQVITLPGHGSDLEKIGDIAHRTSQNKQKKTHIKPQKLSLKEPITSPSKKVQMMVSNPRP